MYEFEDNEKETVQEKSPKNWPETLVRVIGIVLLLIGLWAGIQVLLEALRLYRNPVRIEQLSNAIERGSNLDRNLARRSLDDMEKYGSTTKPSKMNNQANAQDLSLSYFAAWLIALLLLMLVAMIAFSSIRTGSELVLQDRQLKQVMRLLIKHSGDSGKPVG